MECNRKKKWAGGAPLQLVLKVLLCATVLLGAGVCSHASVALLMEEPYGGFGAINPTGHAAVYLNHICAEAPTALISATLKALCAPRRRRSCVFAEVVSWAS